MARKAGGNLNIAVTATDRASPVIAGVGKSVAALPQHLSKAAGAMAALEGAAGGMGSTIAQTAGQVTKLGSLVMSGGPLGIGIAAVTAAVWAATAAYDALKKSTVDLVAAQKALDDNQKDRADSFAKEADLWLEREQKIRDFGKTQLEVEIEGYRQKTYEKEEYNKLTAREIADLEKRAQGVQTMRGVIGGLSEVEKKHLQDLKDRVAHNQVEIEQMAEKADQAMRLASLESNAAREKAAAADAERKAKERLAEAERRRREALAKGLREEAEMLDELERVARRGREEAERAARRAEEDAAKRMLSYWEGIEKQKTSIAEDNAARRIHVSNAEEEAKQRAAEDTARMFASEMSFAFDTITDQSMDTTEKLQAAFSRYSEMALQAAFDYAAAELVKQMARKGTTAVEVAAAGTEVGVATGAATTKTGAVIAEGTTQIGVAAAKGGAEAVAAHASIPFVGLAIGAGIAAAIVAAIYAFKKFHTGGVVEGGGGPGLRPDEQMIVAQRGELVIPAAAARKIAQGGSAPQESRSGGSVTFAPKIEMLGRLSRTEERRMLLRLGRSMEGLVSDGKLLRERT
jgi:hypothetical protein